MLETFLSIMLCLSVAPMLRVFILFVSKNDTGKPT